MNVKDKLIDLAEPEVRQQALKVKTACQMLGWNPSIHSWPFIIGF